MRKILFIINPLAGSNRGKTYKKKIEDYLKDKEVDYEIIETTRAKEAIELAKDRENFDSLVGVGGDGTFQEILTGLGDKKIHLGLIAAGTGNDSLRSLGLQADFESCMERILKGDSKEIDLVRINGEKTYLNVMSLGLDALTVVLTNKYKKWLPKKFAYHVGVAAALFKYRLQKVKINVEGEWKDHNILLLALGNGKYYGGGIKILPRSSMDDGYIDLIMVEKVSFFKLLSLIKKLAKSTHLDDEEVTYKRLKEIEILAQEDTYLNLDGEISLLKKGEKIQVKVDEKALRLLM